MRKIRVYELAKEAGMDSKELAAKLIERGYNIKAYNSTLDEETANRVRDEFHIIKTTVQEKRIQAKGRTTIIRRRKKVVETTEEPPEVTGEKPEPAVHEEPPDASALPITPEPLSVPEQTIKPENPLPPELPVTPEPEPEPEPDQVESKDEDVQVDESLEKSAEKVKVEDDVEVSLPDTSVSEGSVKEKKEKTSPPAPEDDIKSVNEDLVVPVEAGKPEVKEKETVSPPIPEEDKPVAGKQEVAEKIVKPLPKRKGLAKIIGRTKLPLPVEEHKPKKTTRPKKNKKVTAPAPQKDVVPGRRADASKGKKSKRFVKFTHQDSGGRFKKGSKRRGGADVEMEDLARLGGRLAAGVRIGRGPRSQKKKRKDAFHEVSETKAIKKRIKIYETIKVVDLAHRMGIKANEVIAKLIGLGVMATLNQALDVDTATLVASDFGYEVEQGITEEQSVVDLDEQEKGGSEIYRPPVVTVMGHVDHGKTSILDAIRKTDVAAGEAGGITQHIGAHYVRSAHGDLVFLDTPGHAAFTEMRSRGAKVTDVVVLVVAADDGVMDQTREAINHARAAGVPIMVAVNKIDKPDADPARVQRELAELGLVPEDWGGDVIYCETSAKQGTGVEELVENILLQTEILELRADPVRRAKGRVIEAQLHKGRGAVATVIVKHGTLRVGDSFVVGQYAGKVRSLTNDRGKIVKEAGPSVPVEIQGLSGVPLAGDEFVVVADDKMAKNVSASRQIKNREAELGSTTKISLDNLFEKLHEGELKELRVLLRADVQGTLEAFGKALEKLSTDEIKVKILHEGTGTIIESDILLAAASDALIIGFNVRPSLKVQDLAKKENVDLRFYDVIYHALDDIKLAMVGMLDPTFVEKVIGTVEVRQTFHVPKVGTIAGCYVTDGLVSRNAKVRLIRDGVVIFTGAIASLKRFKDDAREVQAGYECGIGIENYNDIKVGDLIEAFILEETTPHL